MRHMTTHDLKKKKVTYLKEEVPGSEGNYMVVEVIEEGEEEDDKNIYEDEDSDVDMQEEELVEEEGENYILTEREFRCD